MMGFVLIFENMILISVACCNFQSDQSRRITTKKPEKGAYESYNKIFQLFKNKTEKHNFS